MLIAFASNEHAWGRKSEPLPAISSQHWPHRAALLIAVTQVLHIHSQVSVAFSIIRSICNRWYKWIISLSCATIYIHFEFRRSRNGSQANPSSPGTEELRRQPTSRIHQAFYSCGLWIARASDIAIGHSEQQDWIVVAL